MNNGGDQMRVETFTKVSQLYQSSTPAKVEKKEKGSKNDTLEISHYGKEFHIAKKAALEAPEVREDKVSAMKNSLASGTYQVSMEEVADKLLEHYF